jgi:hypothetical protein
MRMKGHFRLLGLWCSLWLIGAAGAQSDTSRISLSAADTTAPSTWRTRHIPKRATLYSAMLPGAGQIYNHKYWKAPIAWGGLGVCVYFIQRNNTEFQRYKTAYLAQVDGDPGTVDEFNGRFSPETVRNVADQYQRWRDLSYICLAGVYILNVVDASVDGHFVHFDVGDDLSLDLGPSLPLAVQGATGLSLRLRL